MKKMNTYIRGSPNIIYYSIKVMTLAIKNVRLLLFFLIINVTLSSHGEILSLILGFSNSVILWKPCLH